MLLLSQSNVCFACMTVRMYPVEYYCMHKLFSLTVHAKPWVRTQLVISWWKNSFDNGRTWHVALKPLHRNRFPWVDPQLIFWKETAEISAHCAASNITMALRMRQMRRYSAPSAVCSNQLNNYSANSAPSAVCSTHFCSIIITQ